MGGGPYLSWAMGLAREGGKEIACAACGRVHEMSFALQCSTYVSWLRGLAVGAGLGRVRAGPVWVCACPKAPALGVRPSIMCPG